MRAAVTLPALFAIGVAIALVIALVGHGDSSLLIMVFALPWLFAFSGGVGHDTTGWFLTTIGFGVGLNLVILFGVGAAIDRRRLYAEEQARRHRSDWQW